MSWLIEPFQIAPWIFYLAVAGVGGFCFLLGGLMRPKAEEKAAADDRWSDLP